jgi:hypothetical protein
VFERVGHGMTLTLRGQRGLFSSGVGFDSRVTSAKMEQPILSVNCGSLGIKASVLDSTGTMRIPAVHLATLYPLSSLPTTSLLLVHVRVKICN